MRQLVILLAALLGVWAPAPARAEPSPFSFRDGDRVVLIGDALIEREQEQGMVETLLTILNPDKTITFRNLGWSGDTVFGTARARFGTEADGFKHLKEHVLALKPTVLIVGYGMTDSFAGTAGLPRFASGLNHLLDVLGETGARVVLLAPIAHEDVGCPLPDPTQHNEVLDLYSKAIRTIADERKAHFVDLFDRFHHTMYMLRRGGEYRIADDGIHLTAYGYKLMGISVRQSLQLPFAPVTTENITPTAHGVRFEQTSGSLDFMTRSSTGNYSHRRFMPVLGGLDGISFPGGRYRLIIDGRLAAEADSRVLRQGRADYAFNPDTEQSERLRQVIIAKNRLYFYRWRPQNETYLFGFRKHEQGNNAGEVPLFDPLVEEKEKEIARLKVPVKHVFELIRVGEEAN